MGIPNLPRKLQCTYSNHMQDPLPHPGVFNILYKLIIKIIVM